MKRFTWLLAGFVLLGPVNQQAQLRPGVDPTTRPYWHLAAEAWGKPAADEHSIYYLERSRTLSAVDQRTGQVRWRRSTGSRGVDPFGWLVEVSGACVLTTDSVLQAFDRETGTPRWSFAPADDLNAGSYLGTIVGESAYLGSPAGRVYAVNITTGAQRWRATISTSPRFFVQVPVADQGIVAASYSEWTSPSVGGVVALDPRTGLERWRTSFPRPANAARGSQGSGNPLLVDDVVVAASGHGTIYAFDRGTGSVRWSLPPVEGVPGELLVSADADFRPLALAGRLLIAGSLTGAVTAYSLDTHRAVWRNADQRLASVGFGITTDERTAYVPYLGSRLVAIDLENGAERWRAVQPGGGFSFPPLVAGGRLFATSTTSGLYALRR